MVKSGKSFPPQHCHLCFTFPRSLTSFHFTIQNPIPKKRSKCCHFPIGSWAHQEAETTSCCPLSATLGVNTAWEQQGDKRKGNHPLTAPMADGTMNLSWKLSSASKNTSVYRTVYIQTKLGRVTPAGWGRASCPQWGTCGYWVQLLAPQCNRDMDMLEQVQKMIKSIWQTKRGWDSCDCSAWKGEGLSTCINTC